MRRLRTAVTIALGVGIAAVLLAACSSSPSNSASNTSSGTKIKGGTVTWAEPPSAVPNYIFPFMSLAFFSVTNLSQFQQLMYRPLYWFGNNGTASIQPSLSLAQNPVYSDNNQTVVIKLKNYKWSNGETVNATDVMFWMNMMHAEKANWAAYAPGTIPDNIKSITINSPTQLTFQMTGSYNPFWLTYNQFSQITPLPVAWDITSTGTAPGSGGCSSAAYGTADTACAAVYTFLSKQAGYDPANPSGTNNSLTTYATNPLWQVVDGPWHLTAFDASGDVTMVPNPLVLGPVKPTISVFKEVPFTSDSAEFNSLVAGNLDFGYCPPGHHGPGQESAGRRGQQPPSDQLHAWTRSTSTGSTTSPTTSRRRVTTATPGRSSPSSIPPGLPVPGRPAPVRQQGVQGLCGADLRAGPVLPPDLRRRRRVRPTPTPTASRRPSPCSASHGWTVVPNGTSTCTDPGSGANQCGADIPKGAALNFNLQYATGTTWITQLMTTEKSSWAQVGINITLSSASFDTVLGIAVPCSGSACTWELQDWGGGWEFSPDYYPTGEEIFSTGAGSNSGSYSNATNDANTKATDDTDVNLDTYQDFLAKNLPVIWQPNPAYEMSEISNKLHGATPQNVFGYLTPENWYLTK